MEIFFNYTDLVFGDLFLNLILPIEIGNKYLVFNFSTGEERFLLPTVMFPPPSCPLVALFIVKAETVATLVSQTLVDVYG